MLSGTAATTRRPARASTSRAAPSSARSPAESQNSTSARSTSTRGRRPSPAARLIARQSSGAVARSSSPRACTIATPSSVSRATARLGGSSASRGIARLHGGEALPALEPGGVGAGVHQQAVALELRGHVLLLGRAERPGGGPDLPRQGVVGGLRAPRLDVVRRDHVPAARLLVGGQVGRGELLHPRLRLGLHVLLAGERAPQRALD